MTLRPSRIDDCGALGVGCPHPFESKGSMPELLWIIRSRTMGPWSDLMMGRLQTTL